MSISKTPDFDHFGNNENQKGAVASIKVLVELFQSEKSKISPWNSAMRNFRQLAGVEWSFLKKLLKLILSTSWDQSPSSTSAEVEIPKTRFDFVKTEKVPFFASCIYKVNAFLAKGKKEETNNLYTKNGCRISEIFP